MQARLVIRWHLEASAPLKRIQDELVGRINSFRKSHAVQVDLVRPIDRVASSPWSVELTFESQQKLGQFLDAVIESGGLAHLAMELPEGARLAHEATVYTVETYGATTRTGA